MTAPFYLRPYLLYSVLALTSLMAAFMTYKWDRVYTELERCRREQTDIPVKLPVSCYNCDKKETFGHRFDEFENVVDRYREERWRPINEALSSGRIVQRFLHPDIDSSDRDARAIWFSLDSLKQFICTIEKYSALLTKKPDTLGIRMYYAVYDSSHPKFPLRHTLFMVPTFKMKGNPAGMTGADFDPRYLYRHPQLMKEPANSFLVQRGGTGQALILAADTRGQDLRANDGDLCPPCNKGCVHQLIDFN